MHDWIQHYPRVAALLQGDDEALLYATAGDADEERRSESATVELSVSETWVIARTTGARILVSTVLLSIDEPWTRQGGPLLCETRVWAEGVVRETVQLRSNTWESAQAGHNAICQAVRRWLDTGGGPEDDEERQP
jgi:hypothetical protein